MARPVLRIARHTDRPLVPIPIMILVLGLLLATVPTAVAQTISGRVNGGAACGDAGCDMRGIHVTFLDSMNALPLAETQTVVEGFYDSGTIPTGSYRIRFSDPDATGDKGCFGSQFFGETMNEFCAGTIVSVLAGSTFTADASLRWVYCGPWEVIPYSATVRGWVLDAETKVPLSGIQVSLLHARTASQLMKTTTDTKGFYFFNLGPGTGVFRLRFSDPANRYLPTYYTNKEDELEAGDNYCLGRIITVMDQETKFIDEYLVGVPPEELTRNLVEQVQILSSDLPSNVSTMLGSSLAQVVNLLADADTSNDVGACGQLAGFISRVKTQQNKGQLSSEEASSLIQSAEYIRTQLGCK